MLASLFTPRTAFFLKNKTKPKAALSWLVMGAVCLLLVGVLAPVPEKPADDPAQAIKALAAQQRNLEQNEVVPVTPALTPEQQAEHIAFTRQQVKGLLSALDTLRNDPTFYELGFSANNPAAVDWKAKTETLRATIENDQTLPVMLRTAPGALLVLGLEWQKSKGETTSLAKDCLEQIFQGLND